MEWLFFIVGLGIGWVIGWFSKPSTPSNDDPDGKLKQSISDKLDKIIEDVKNTV